MKPTIRSDRSELVSKQLSALYEEYRTRVKEIESFSTRYHRQVGYIQTYLAALSSLGSYIYFTQPSFFISAATKGEHSLEIVLVLMFLASFLFYLFSIILDSLHVTTINGKNVAQIEQRINKMLKKDVMLWETKIIPHFLWNPSLFVANGWVRPGIYVFLIVGIIFLSSTLILCFFCYNFASIYFGYYVVPVMSIAIFLLWQWLMFVFVGAEVIDKEMAWIRGNAERVVPDNDIIKFVIPMLTIIFGYWVFVISAIQTDSFFPSSQYIFGLFVLPSILIGDVLLIPLVNQSIYVYLKNRETTEVFKYLLICTPIALVASAAIHYAWVHDAYFGFMDFEYGKLTFAGWWHFGFTAIELSLIFTTLAFGIKALIFKRNIELKEFLRPLRLLSIFLSFSVLDFLSKHFIVFSRTFDELFDAVALDWVSMLPFVISVGFYMRLKMIVNSSPVQP